MSLVLALAVPLALAACATSRVVYLKEGTSQADARKDTYECQRDSTYTAVVGPAPYSVTGYPVNPMTGISQPVPPIYGGYTTSYPDINERLYATCMEVRGYASERWTKPDLKGAKFEIDSDECGRDARSDAAYGLRREVFDQCMTSRGYMRADRH